MTPSRWQQVEELYHAALECEPSQRAALLARADPEIRREVESLLAQPTGDGLLARPAWERGHAWNESTVTQVSIGTQLGPYKLDAPLGKGGMGEVFQATDTRLHRTVAIKILPRDSVADPERRRRLLQEARAASALNHPNIVTLHDVASDAGVDYLVMEYVPGQSLHKLLSLKRLPLAETLNYAQQIATGLAAAHAAGIVHRDIKPGNIIVTPESQVKILDFGLAKIVERPGGAEERTQTLDPASTETGTVVGTVAYMSPEQAGAKTIDHRTDIFSLGIILYEMLARIHPFRGKSPVETLHAIIHDPVPPLSRQPAELQEILDKTLAKDPKDRYQHPGDLALDLRRFEQRSTGARQTAPAAGRVSNRLWIAAAVLLSALLAAWWASRGRTPATADNPLAGAQFTRLTDFPGDETSASISPDGKFVAFISDRDGRQDLWLTHIGTGRFQNLTAAIPWLPTNRMSRQGGFTGDGTEIWLPGGAVSPPVRMRLVPLMGGPPRPFLGEKAVSVGWSQDGARIVYHTSDPGDPTFVADRNGSNARQIFVDRPGVHNHSPAWSPDGKWIYFVHGNLATTELNLWRIQPTGGQPEPLTQSDRYTAFPTPLDSRTVLYIAEDQDGSGPWLWAFDLQNKAARRVSFGLEKYTSIAASADSRRLVAAVANPVANLWTVPLLERLAEESDTKPYPLPNVRALAPRFGGKSLFYLSSQGSGDGLWRLQDGQTAELWKGSDGALLEPPAISGDGSHAALVVRRNGKQRLWVLQSDGSQPRVLTEAIDVRGAASWSPDGKWIVSGGNDTKGAGVFKIQVEGGAPIRLADAGLNPVWSPKGDLIVYSGGDVGGVEPLRAVKPDGAPVDVPAIQLRRDGERFRFTPDGKHLVYMQGGFRGQDFWILNLATRQTRQLTHLANLDSMRTFDISPDGKQIVFDRLRNNSDIVVIDLPAKTK
jgi:Tol biopolymer transport system component/predicted Ser/Thr protein kinase